MYTYEIADIIFLSISLKIHLQGLTDILNYVDFYWLSLALQDLDLLTLNYNKTASTNSTMNSYFYSLPNLKLWNRSITYNNIDLYPLHEIKLKLKKYFWNHFIIKANFDSNIPCTFQYLAMSLH